MKFTVPLLFFILSVLSAAPASAKPLHHFAFFGMDREETSDDKG
jgi:hypothetical protein